MSYPRTKDPNRCPEIVPTAGLRMSYHQCRGKVAKDGYCRVHHPDAVRERRIEAQRKYDEKWAKSPVIMLKAEQERNADLERRLTVARQALEWASVELGKCTKPNPVTKALTLTAPKP